MIGRTAAPIVARTLRANTTQPVRQGAMRRMGGGGDHHDHRVFKPPFGKGETIFWWSFTVFVPIATTFWAVGFQQRKQGYWK